MVLTEVFHRAAIDFEEMAAGVNKRRIIQREVFNELCRVSAVIVLLCKMVGARYGIWRLNSR